MTERGRLGVARNVLLCCLLAILCWAGLELALVLHGVSQAVPRLENRATASLEALDRSLEQTQAVLSSIRGTTEQVRKSAEYQLGYYEAVGRRTSNAIASLQILIDNTDDRLERITLAAERVESDARESVRDTVALAALSAVETRETMDDMQTVLQETGETVEALRARVQDERWDAAVDSFAAANANLKGTTENLEQAAANLRDTFAPKKRRFWSVLATWSLKIADAVDLINVWTRTE